MPNLEADLIVVGGGALGTFHALAATERGLRVILLERDATASSATVRNFGQIVPSGMNQRWQRLGRESIRIYQSLQKQVDLSIRNLGSIYLASDKEELTLLEELAEINATEEYPSQLWTPDQCCRRLPELRRESCRGGLFFPEELSVNPRAMIHRLHRFLGDKPSMTIRFRTSVHQLSVSGSGKVHAEAASGDVFTADKAIVCSGHDFKTLYPALYRDSALQAVKLQMLRLRPQRIVSLPGNILTGSSIRRYESFAQCPSWPVIKAREPGDSFDKKFGIHILLKQETDGSIILGDSHEYASAADTDALDFSIRQDINDHLISAARKIFALPSWEIQCTWFGTYSQMSDDSEIFTHRPDTNIHIVTGIGGKGMTGSAGFARQHLGEIYND